MKAILLTAMLMSTILVQAQGPLADQKEKVEAMKIAYITKELNLTPSEAQQFWPVYNKFNDELELLRKNRKNDLIAVKLNMDNMSDADLAKAIDNELAFQQQELDLRKKYIEEYKKVLPIRKVAKLMRAEHTFKMELLREFKHRPGDGLPAPPPPHEK
jgi:Spy/CpxP family protein refolding chaperone